MLDSDGLGDEVGVAAAMVAAVRDGAQILNLSFGAEASDDQPPLALAVAIELIDEIRRLESREVVLVAAAGNSASTTPTYPSAFAGRGMVAVAALTPASQPAPWSSRGPWVDCAAVCSASSRRCVGGAAAGTTGAAGAGPAGAQREHRSGRVGRDIEGCGIAAAPGRGLRPGPEAYTGHFYDGPHKFDPAMQAAVS